MNEEINNKKTSTPIQDLVDETKKDSTIGPMIGSFIVICIIIVGGLYFLGLFINQKTNSIEQNERTQEVKNEIIIKQTIKQSDSEDIETIEADLKATDLQILDDALKQIEAEM
jgi:hypothetical protein